MEVGPSSVRFSSAEGVALRAAGLEEERTLADVTCSEQIGFCYLTLRTRCSPGEYPIVSSYNEAGMLQRCGSCDGPEPESRSIGTHPNPFEHTIPTNDIWHPSTSRV